MTLLLAAMGLAAGATAAPAPPPNDLLENAAEVVGDRFILEADLGAATREEFEPSFGSGFGHTAWWTWTAPASGVILWNSEPNSNLVGVTVFRRGALGQLVQEAASYWRSRGTGGRVPDRQGSFQAALGERYLIQLDWPRELGDLLVFPWPGTDSPYPVSVTFEKSALSPPTNDALAQSMSLVGATALLTVDLSAATAEIDEPRVAPDALGRTLWWTWVAPDYGSARIQARDTNSFPVVGIYTRGAFLALDLVATSATRFGNECHSYAFARSFVEWDTTPGERYEIQVDQFPQMYPLAPAELEFAFTTAPVNDAPETAQPILGVEAALNVSTAAATLRPDEFHLPGQSGANSVWFRWLAAASGVLQVTCFEPLRYDDPAFEPTGETGVISTIQAPPCGAPDADLNPLPPFAPVFGLFRRDAFAGAPTDRPTTFLTHGTNSFTAEVDAQSDYWIALDGDRGSSGETTLNLLLTPPPSNDDFTNRIVLPAQSLKVTGRTFAATRKTPEPLYFENGQPLRRAVWWEWRAPSAGRWTLFIVKGASENRFLLFRGPGVEQENPVGSSTYELLVFHAEAGEVFEIGVYALGGFGGRVQFTLTPVQPPAMRVRGFRDYFFEPSRSVELILPDNSGLPYVIEQSTDLATWTAVFTNANAWSHRLHLPSVSGRPAEFFRSRLLDELSGAGD